MSSGSSHTVMIADDEAHIRALVSRLVRGMGLQLCAEASTGAEAIEIYREKTPDLLLLDINMTVKDGIETLQEIRAEFPEAVVVMLTSVSDMDSVKKCISMGAVDYILKSSTLDEIRNTISKALNLS